LKSQHFCARFPVGGKVLPDHGIPQSDSPPPKPAKQGIGSGGEQLTLFEEGIQRVGTAAPSDLEVIIVDSEQKLADLEAKLQAAQEIALDTETTSITPMTASLVGVSMSVKEGEGFYIPVGHKTGDKQLPLDKVVKEIRPILEDANKRIIGHNLKFDVILLKRHGCNPATLYFDTMIAEWLLHPDSHNLGLKDLAETYLGIRMTHIEELIGSGKTKSTCRRFQFRRQPLMPLQTLRSRSN